MTDLRNGDADTVYIAEGRYVPETGVLGTAVFSIPLGARVFWGFRNGDSDEFSRTGDARATVLDGDITDDGPTMDDALHVITIDTTTGGGAVLLDGVHVTRGLAAGAATVDQQGGGILCIGADLTLRGCVFSQNAASRGGAIWFEGDGVADGFRAFNTIFFANTATETGGAIQLEVHRQRSPRTRRRYQNRVRLCVLPHREGFHREQHGGLQQHLGG